MTPTVSSRTRIAALVIVLLAAAWTTGVWAAQAPGPSDRQLLREVQQQVLGYSHYTVFDSISASIKDGVVTLTGKVTTSEKREDLAKRVASVRGVRQLQNRIEVLPASRSDDELRQVIARSIYDHPTFRPYATHVNPPIHIVVERGRVTLEGVVTDQAEKLLAASLSGGFGAFSVKNDLKTTAEARAELAKF